MLAAAATPCVRCVGRACAGVSLHHRADRVRELASERCRSAANAKLKLVELRVKGKAAYSEVVQFSRNGENRGRKLVDLIEELSPGKSASPFCKLDEIMFTTLDGDDVKAATVVLQFA